MPRDGGADEATDALDPLTALPAWVKGEKRLSSMLPYVSLVTDRTIRTRGNELMQCIRLEGVNSTTSEDAHLDRIGGLLAGIVAQVGTEFSFYLHKVSKVVDVTLPPIPGEGFAAAVDQRWRAHLARSGLRDKTLTLTVLKRPETGSRLPFGLRASRARHAADTTRRLRKLDEVVGFLLSSFDELKPRLLSASTGELLGFLGSLNTGEEHPLFPRSALGVIAEDVANTRVTFRGTTIALSDGAVGDKVGAIFAVKNYPAKTDSLMLDELNLPVDMVVTHSFVPINANIMSGRIKRQLRLMQATNDGAVNPEGRLLVNMFADVALATGDGTPVVQVPETAVIDTGDRQVVIQDMGEGKFAPQDVVLGRQGSGMVEIREGIAAGDRIVTTSTFLIDAESNLNAALAALVAPEAAE